MKKTHLLLPISSLIFMNNVYAATVGLTWYDGNSTISGASSCTVGGTFVPPTPPARTGYIFTGWNIKEIHVPETCGIPNLDTSISRKGPYDAGYYPVWGSGSYLSKYGLTIAGQWAVEFSYGTVWGVSNCNNTNGGTSNTVEAPDTSVNGQYCWCQATGFSPSGSDYTSGPQCTTSASSLWVFQYDRRSSENCAYYCAQGCKNETQNGTGFRAALFGSVAQ